LEHIQERIDIARMNYNREDFNKLRETVIHNIRPEFKIQNKALLVPENFDWFTSQQLSDVDTWEWGNHDFSKIKYIPFYSHLNKLLETSITLFNESLQKTLLHFEAKFEKHNLLIDCPDVFIYNKSTPSSVDSSTFVHPSGMNSDVGLVAGNPSGYSSL
jgi:hypothetical protein